MLVTGGSAGLGLVIAKSFAASGYRVILVGRSAQRLDAALETFAGDPGQANVAILRGDLSKKADVERIAGTVRDRFGRLDVLVNCVGTSDRGLVDDLSSERLHELIDQNVATTLLCCQTFLPLLEITGGCVVNIGSLAGKVGARYLGGYNAAKHALAGLTQQMRLEWKDKGVHVGLVSPGPIRREDAGIRYKDRTGGALPESALKPGGGTKVKGLDAQKVADAVFKCAQKRRPDIILPGYMRFLVVLGNASPRLGDWLLLKFTS